jgi:signal transduction histidine kinase
LTPAHVPTAAGARLTRGPLGRAALTTLLLGAATTVGAATYLVARGLATPGVALAWQGLTYLTWVPLAVGAAWTIGRAERRGRAWVGMLLAWAPATLLHGLASAALTRLIWDSTRPSAPRPFGEAVRRHVVGELPVEILQYWAIVAALTVVETRRRLRERERAAARLEAELTRARLAALRARVQPHFLFNTLQSISFLIPRDPAAAQRMAVNLGDLLRASFAPRGDGAADGDGGEVRLGDELALARAYVDVEAERFRDRLDVCWDVDAAPADALVPDLVVQPLVENALRHGLWPRPGRGTLTVRATVARPPGDGARLVLTVEDDGLGLPPDWRDGACDGVGLGATRARLLGLHGSAARLTVDGAPGGGTRATLELPLRLAPGAPEQPAPEQPAPGQPAPEQPAPGQPAPARPAPAPAGA